MHSPATKRVLPVGASPHTISFFAASYWYVAVRNSDNTCFSDALPLSAFLPWLMSPVLFVFSRSFLLPAKRKRFPFSPSFRGHFLLASARIPPRALPRPTPALCISSDISQLQLFFRLRFPSCTAQLVSSARCPPPPPPFPEPYILDICTSPVLLTVPLLSIFFGVTLILCSTAALCRK